MGRLLFPFERANHAPYYRYNFRRQLAKAARALSERLALPEDMDLMLRPVTAGDMALWRDWKNHPAMQDRRVRFHWGDLHEDDGRENEPFGRRTCVAFIARGRLCGLAHMMVSRDGGILLMTQMEAAPGDHPLKGRLGYGVIDAALCVAQGLGCDELWLGGPFYDARLARSCHALGFRPHDDGMYVHYIMNVDRDTRLDPALFFAGAGRGDAGLCSRPGHAP